MLDKRLSPFGLNSVLLGIARIAAILRTWQNEPDFSTDRVLAKRFLPTYYADIKRLYENASNRLTFTRLNLLFVAKQACRVCTLEGKNIESAHDVEQILSCCLLANDLLLGRLPTPTDAPIDKAANLLPFSNYVPRNSYPTDLARNMLIIEEIGPQLVDRKDYIDLATVFKAGTGMAPRDFCQLAFAAAIKFITNIETQLNDPATAFLLALQYFQHTSVAQKDIIAFLQSLSTTSAELRAHADADSPGADFLALQQHPLIEYTADRYMCPDPGFLLDKAGPSLFWTLHGATDRQNDLLAYWAGVIECYTHWLFTETYQGRGQWHPGPRFANGDEAADLYLVEGSELVLLEVKASILTTRAKYGFSPDILLSELHKKAITGVANERKGVAQLSHNLQRFLAGDEILGVERSRIKTIYPVLVFLDHGFTAPYLNIVYNEYFGSAFLRRKYRMRITPIFSLTIDDLENVLPHTDRHGFTDILDSYYRANRNMYGELSHSRVPILQGEPPGRDPVRQRFQQFGEDLERTFFPGEKANAT